MSGSSPIPNDLPSEDACAWSLADRALLGACGPDVSTSLRIVEYLDESFDYAAAATDIALFPPAERPPEALRRRVTATLGRLSEASRPSPIPMPQTAATTATTEIGAPTTASTGRWGWIAAAAAIAIAVAAWWPVTEIDRTTPDGSPALFRNALLADRSTAVVACACTEDPLCIGSGECGDIVWNAERGEGYLRLVGVEPNDPSEFQYQLWIVDAGRAVSHRRRCVRRSRRLRRGDRADSGDGAGRRRGALRRQRREARRHRRQRSPIRRRRTGRLSIGSTPTLVDRARPARSATAPAKARAASITRATARPPRGAEQDDSRREASDRSRTR